MAYWIEDGCSGCGMCAEACPTVAIDERRVPFSIDPERCVDCGVCQEECPLDVIHAPGKVAASV